VRPPFHSTHHWLHHLIMWLYNLVRICATVFSFHPSVMASLFYFSIFYHVTLTIQSESVRPRFHSTHLWCHLSNHVTLRILSCSESVWPHFHSTHQWWWASLNHVTILSQCSQKVCRRVFVLPIIAGHNYSHNFLEFHIHINLVRKCVTVLSFCLLLMAISILVILHNPVGTCAVMFAFHLSITLSIPN